MRSRARPGGPRVMARLYAAAILFMFSVLLLSTYTQASSSSDENSLAFSHRETVNAHRLGSSFAARRKESGRTRATIGDADQDQDALDDLILSDLVIVSSVEGGMYGLDRETGKQLWSLPPLASNASLAHQHDSNGFGPLVGTTYGPKHRSFVDMAADVPLIDAPPASWDGKSHVDGSSGKEALDAMQKLGLYIVEPSNGQVYVLTTPPSESSDATAPKSTLSKLPLTLPQLVELSPFSFPGDSSRVFVGRKSTSLVEIDVRTGEVGAVFGGQGKEREGVWCENINPLMQNNATCTQDPAKEWAYMGRTDYTLSIHLRGRPALTQTLHFSTFAPNAADRRVASLWQHRLASPDKRAIMGMPEEGTLLCFNASMPGASPREQQERTLWIQEMGATIAGIFDVVYHGTLIEQEVFQPLILPHPKGTLDSLFGSLPTSYADRTGSIDAVLDRQRSTYLGIADGKLYAMASEQYPLVAFTQPASSGRSEGDGDEFYDHHRRGANTCQSYGCLLGSYEIEGDQKADKEGLLGLGSGHAPLLGIGDGSEQGQDEENATDHNHSGREAKQDGFPRLSADSWSSWMTPTMIMYQIIALFFFACICGMIYIGGQELRKQHAEAAKVASRDLIWTTPTSTTTQAVASGKTENGSVNGGESVTTSQAAEETREGEKPQTGIDEPTENGPEKKKTGRRRRRGKRAGVAVAHREGKRGEDREEENRDEAKEDVIAEGESDEEDVGDAERKDARSKVSASPAALKKDAVKPTVVVQTSENGEDDAAEAALRVIAAKSTLSAEGGRQIELQNGETASARGDDRSLIISEDILGYGSSGTVVFKGTFQGRSVAVKRLLRDFVDVAAKEVSLLESADNHANVIRYFYKEVTDSFLFIALELCPASLSDIIEKPREYQELSALLKPKRALFQISSGLQHLHSLSIVHRDIKPQNILVLQMANGQLKMLLSDFGLSKRLDGVAQTSFSQTVNNPGGTFGWRAPEILRGEVMLETNGDGEAGSSSLNSTQQSRKSNGSQDNTAERKRLTRAVDIFALGCLTYYLLSNGDHPFGTRFEREMNILKSHIDLSRLDGLGEEGHEAQHLIMRMIEHEAQKRPNALDVMAHPYFWDAARRLAFLQDASDRFDIMERDPPAATLVALEENATSVVGQDWHRRVDRQVMEDLNKRRRYDGKSVAALLRAIRNKKHHIHDVPPNVRRLFTAAGGIRTSLGNAGDVDFGQMMSSQQQQASSSVNGTTTSSSSAGNLTHVAQLLPDGFLAYFTSRFPRLFLHTYEVVNSFDMLKREPSFTAYFKPIRDDL